MTNTEFNSYLLTVAKIANDLKELLQCAVNELDVDLTTEYSLDIDTILFDLNNVKVDCEFLARIMSA